MPDLAVQIHAYQEYPILHACNEAFYVIQWKINLFKQHNPYVFACY